METLKVVIFCLLFIDSIVVNLIAWFFRDWYAQNMKPFSEYLPMAKAWTVWYLILVLWMGFLIFS